MNDIRVDKFQEINSKLYSILPQEQKDIVFASDYCDIEPSFLGFVDTYYHLSKIIPKHFTVIDLGCAYNAQSFFFTEYKKYIAVDFDRDESNAFHTPNTEFVKSSIENFVIHYEEEDVSRVFAICNYVNTRRARQLVSSVFPNCYCFYPATGLHNTSFKDFNK